MFATSNFSTGERDTNFSSNAVDLSPRVQAALDWFREHGLWHVVSRNSPATSCRDAAARRLRLGTQGIPLHDELKSLCVVVYRGEQRQYALLHSRANARFDLRRAASLLGANRPLVRVSNEDLSNTFDTVYGSVNPFSEANRFVQVFDTDILSTYSPPNTMMTNLGGHTWAVEFEPKAVIETLEKGNDEVLVGDICERVVDVKGPGYNLPVIGIVTGNGPESGMALWRHINQRVHDVLSVQKRMAGDLAFPHVLVHSLPEMGLSMELVQREGAVWRVLEKASHDLCRAGVTHLAIACNTTPFFAERIQSVCQSYGRQFVSIADVAYQQIVKNRWDSITLLGIPLVAEMGEHSAYRKLAALDVKPVDRRVLEDLQELGYMVKRMALTGKNSKILNKLHHIIRAGVQTKRVMIALTEISVLLERFPKLRDRIGNVDVIDPLRMYGDFLAEQFLRALPDPGRVEWDEQWEAE